MARHLAISVKLVIISTVLLGIVYPLAITGISQVLFPEQADGSLAAHSGRMVGSYLIGQPFVGPEYFHPRPSAAGPGYDASASGGSNLGPTSKALSDRVSADVVRRLEENHGLKRGAIPVDMVTTSGSGLDPDITPANAYAQGARVSEARGMTGSQVASLIAVHTTGRQFGILGEPRINVLELNLALDDVSQHR